MKKKLLIGVIVGLAIFLSGKMGSGSFLGAKIAFGYGGGGGGGGANTVNIVTYCSAVSYGDWGACMNSNQTRGIISQGPAGCTLSDSQQAARLQSCETVVAKPLENVKPEVLSEPITNPAPKQVLGVKKYADGTLLKNPAGQIYVTVGGKLKRIVNTSDLAKYRGPVLKVTDATIASFEPAIENKPPSSTVKKVTVAKRKVAATKKAVLGVKKYANGTLLRGPDWRVYLFSDGKLQHLAGPSELSKHRQTIVNVDSSVISSLPKANENKPPGTANKSPSSENKPPGAAIKPPGTANKSPATAKPPSNEKKPPGTENKPPGATGSPPTVLGVKKYADGSLLRSWDNYDIYLIKNGKKVHIQHLADLQKYHTPILEVTSAELANY